MKKFAGEELPFALFCTVFSPSVCPSVRPSSLQSSSVPAPALQLPLGVTLGKSSQWAKKRSGKENTPAPCPPLLPSPPPSPSPNRDAPEIDFLISEFGIRN